MDRIAGKWVVGALAICAQFTDATVHLRVRDEQQRAVKQVIVGQPFVIEVTLDGEHGNGRNPTLEGLDQFTPTGRQTSMQTVNGVTKTSYFYTVIAPKPGTYTVGPAYIMNNGSKVASQKITITVSEDTEQNHDNIESVIVRFSADKTAVVVGEPVRCTLHVLRADDTIIIHDVQQPAWQKCTVKGDNKAVKRTQDIDGITYDMVEWTWYLYPEKPGRLEIPAVSVSFKEPIDDNQGSMRFSFFFSQRYKNRRVYSQPVKIDVNPLPLYGGTVHGIGEFEQFQTTLTPHVVHEGEGMVFTLSLKRWRDGNVMHYPALEGIPAALRTYQSRTFTTEQPNGSFLDCVEYVMHGVTPGEWEIPPQSFTYFDLGLHRYKTLQTQPTAVIINPSGKRIDDHNKAAIHQSEQELPNGRVEYLADDKSDDIRPLDEDHPWYQQQQRAIPLPLFIFFVCAPLFWLGFIIARQRWAAYRIRTAPRLVQKQAFGRARAALHCAEKSGDYVSLYSIFIQLFIDRCDVREGDDCNEQIMRALANAGLAHHDCQAWHLFFTALAQHAFCQPRHAVDDQLLYAQAYNWLALLEKVL